MIGNKNQRAFMFANTFKTRNIQTAACDLDGLDAAERSAQPSFIVQGSPAAGQTFFEKGRATLSQEWANTPIDAWDHAVQQREQVLLRRGLEIEETAIAWLQAALAKTAPYTVAR